MLTLEDGFPRRRPEARNEVAHLQRLLTAVGEPLKADGYFGVVTEEATKRFQARHGLDQDGVVDEPVWLALERDLAGGWSEPRDDVPAAADGEGTRVLTAFRGDLGWVHEQEGHAGRPYWPGGRSGVTLDPGFDLAHQSFDGLKSLYGGLLTPEQLGAAKQVLRKAGREAKRALNSSPTLLAIRLSRSQALLVMPAVAESYWNGICRRFPTLRDTATPAGVQTALLSLAYNRGINNADLDQLAGPLAAQEWRESAQRIAGMQQNHELPGIRQRRQREASLILDEIMS